MRVYHWAWILAAATSSSVPPLACLFFGILILHVVYDTVPGSFRPIRERIAALPAPAKEKDAPKLDTKPDAKSFKEEPKPAPTQPEAATGKLLRLPDALNEADVPPDTPAIGLPVVRLEDIADLDNLWIVGPKGSGKTTVLRRLLELRRGKHWAIDPHATPGKWPSCTMVGGGRNFAAIDLQLDKFITWMDGRYKNMDNGSVTESQCSAARRTLVGDEWRAIRKNLPGAKDMPSAAARLLDILSEGRKAGICALAASHLDTAEGMGISGEKDMLKCFDMIIYLGAMATKYVPAVARMARPAVVYDPEHEVWAQLIIVLPMMPNAEALDDKEEAPTATPAPIHQRQTKGGVKPFQGADADLLAGLLDGNDFGNDGNDKVSFPKPETSFPASPRDVSSFPKNQERTKPPLSRQEIEIIMRELELGTSRSDIAKRLPGYNARLYKQYRAKVDCVADLLANYDSPDDDPDAPGGPDLPDAFNF